MTREEPRFVVSYLDTNGRELWSDEHEWIPPVIGNGIVDQGGRRWRIVDVWVVHQEHGWFQNGVYAFLELADGDTDRLANIAPQYYYGEPEPDEG